MNYATFVVKIFKIAEKILLEDNILFAEVPVQFYQLPTSNSEKIINLTFWGNLANEIVQYYKANDYIIVEGYISYRKMGNTEKQIEISVFKIYPYLLNIIEQNK